MKVKAFIFLCFLCLFFTACASGTNNQSFSNVSPTTATIAPSPSPTLATTPVITPTIAPTPTITATPIKTAEPTLPPTPAPTQTPQKQVQQPAEVKEVVVYVTKTGEKYHRDGCRYLRQSKIPMNLSEARKRFGPCSVCNPPR